MFIVKLMTPENYPSFIDHPNDMLASWAVMVQDGGRRRRPRGRRTIYMVTQQGDEYAVINERGEIKLTGRSIGELVRAHSDGYTFFYIEIK
jgi:hypothetical protein